jgi:hypothetical protein
VTAEDYKSLVMREYPTADSIYVWGGEEMDPPQYGRVFVSVRPKSGFTLTAEEKNYLTKTILSKKNMVAVSPIIMDPEYLFIKYNITTTYNADQELLDKNTFRETVKERVISWSAENLGNFDQNFRHSKFVSVLDGMSQSILDTTVNIMLEQRFRPSFTNQTNYELRFENPLFHPHEGHMPILKSTPFIHKDTDGITDVKCYLDDDGKGAVRIYKLVDGNKVYVNKDAGKIDYASGLVTLVKFLPMSLSDNYITLRIVVKPESSSINGRKNKLLYFDPYDASALKNTVIAETIYKTSG